MKGRKSGLSFYQNLKSIVLEDEDCQVSSNWSQLSCIMKLITFFLLTSFVFVYGQENQKLTVGFEQDALPYVFNGYFANVWVGEGHVRSRLLLAQVTKPDFILANGFTNNQVTAVALTADYFLKPEWRGWWVSAGAVCWKNSIQTTDLLQTAHFNTWLLNGSLGYSWKFYRNFYVSPWVGLHVKVAGDKEVAVDSKTYKPPRLNPEASIKIGWHF
jgi:hypothetical protein